MNLDLQGPPAWRAWRKAHRVLAFGVDIAAAAVLATLFLLVTSAIHMRTAAVVGVALLALVAALALVARGLAEREGPRP